MSFKEWLPITKRNRVALGLAALALVMFVVWNCLPSYPHGATKPEGSIGMTLWPHMISPDLYLMALKNPGFEGFLNIATVMALILDALVTLAAVPFWKHIHASLYIRQPLAIMNLFGVSVILWHLHEVVTRESQSH